jgi:preprotein translocase subunit YajC
VVVEEFSGMSGEIVAVGVVLILILAAYWSFVIFPKQRDFKKHNNYVRTLHVGDEVITYGGIIGTIAQMDQESGVAWVKVAENVELKMLTAALTRPYVPDEVANNAAIGVEDAVTPTPKANRA